MDNWEGENEIPFSQLKELLESEKAPKERELPIKLRLRGAVRNRENKIDKVRVGELERWDGLRVSLLTGIRKSPMYTWHHWSQKGSLSWVILKFDSHKRMKERKVK